MFKHKSPMMMMMKIAKICCAAVLALGLAACGSETVTPGVTIAPGALTQADVAAQVEQALEVRDIDTAQKLAKAASAAALAHYNSADQKATDARATAVEARGEADRAVRAADGFRRRGQAGYGGRNGCDRGRNGAG